MKSKSILKFEDQRHLFDLPDDVAYFDCATISPLPRATQLACLNGSARELRPWLLTERSFFDDAELCRALAAELIGATADDIAIVPGAAYGIAVAAANIPVARDQEILVLAGQHTANTYSWQKAATAAGARIRTVEREPDADWTSAILHAISAATAVAALPHNHSSDGRTVDLVAIGAALRKQGAALVVDATHSLGARHLDVTAIQPDFLVAACYKWLLGPYATAMLYAAPHRQNGRSIEEPGLNRAGSSNFAGNTSSLEGYLPGARRYDVSGRGNFGLLPGLEASLRYVTSIGVKTIEGALSGLTRRIAHRLTELDLPCLSPPTAQSHYVSLELRAADAAEVSTSLADNQIYVSARKNWLRITPHIYSASHDVDRLIETLKSAMTGR